MKVTREMISAAHGVTLEKGDVILSADLLERIYLAMDSIADREGGPMDEEVIDILRGKIAKLEDLLGKANALARIRAERIKELEACVERMRVAGGSHEFHMAFELAKDALAKLGADKGEGS